MTNCPATATNHKEFAGRTHLRSDPVPEMAGSANGLADLNVNEVDWPAATFPLRKTRKGRNGYCLNRLASFKPPQPHFGARPCEDWLRLCAGRSPASPPQATRSQR